jgi:hypothetical protein
MSDSTIVRSPRALYSHVYDAVARGEQSGVVREEYSLAGGWVWWVSVRQADGIEYRDLGVCYTRWGAERRRTRGLKRAGL